MSALEAARIGDQIGHTCAMKGFWRGLVIGFIVTGVVLLAAGATIATGGAAAVVIGALIAGTAGGALSGIKIGAQFDSDPMGPIKSGSSDTFLGPARLPAARATLDFVLCDDHDKKRIAQGSETVFINGAHAARRSEKTECDAKIREGEPTIFFGGETYTTLQISPEVSPKLLFWLQVAVLVGGAIATGGAVLTVGWGAALCGLGGSIVGGKVFGALGREVGGALWGEKGAVILETVGEFGGSLFGGARGAKLGLKGESMLPTDILARLPGATPEHINARMDVARDFYTNSPNFKGSSAADINSHMSGIDFTQPVRVRTVEQGTTLDQFQNPGQPATSPGSYLAKSGTRPSEIGIGDLGRNSSTADVGPKQVQTYEFKQTTQVLESTASPKNDFFAVSDQALTRGPLQGNAFEGLLQPSRGGGTQVVIGDKSVLSPVGPSRSVDSSLLQPGTSSAVVPGTPLATPGTAPAALNVVPVRGDGTFTAPSVGGTGASIGGGLGDGSQGSAAPGDPGSPP